MGIKYFFSTVLLISSLALICIEYYAWKKDKLYISLSLIPVSVYALGYAAEILCTNIEWVKFWVKVEYFGCSFLGVLWLMFALNFTGYKEKIKNRRLVLLYIMPVIILVVNCTNDFHHLFYKKMYMNNDGIFPILEVVHGPWYWVHTVYNYALMWIGLMIFIMAYLRAVTIVRKQILFLIIAWTIPWISDAIYSLELLPINVDLCPIGLSIAGIMSSYVALKFKFLNITPIAIEKVFSNMLDGVIIIDSENNIVNFNSSAKDIISELNFMKEDNKKIDEILKKYEVLIKAIHSNDYDEGLISINSKDKLKYYKININYIYEKNEKIIGKILILNDITESKEQQEKLLKLNTFKDNLFTVVSHDIKSPLGVLVSLLDLFEDEEDIYKEENKEILYEIKTNVKNTYEMVENVLQWFKSQSDGVVYTNLSWRLSDIMKNSLRLLEENAKLKGINVFCEIQKDIFVFVDKEMFEIVLRNLFSNAIKFTNKGGNIKIWAQESEGIVTIAVKDSGIGIENARVKEMFNNSGFHTTFGTSGEKGTGIGLMICKHLIEKNKGRIWVESSIGKGSTFYFTILKDKDNLVEK